MAQSPHKHRLLVIIAVGLLVSVLVGVLEPSLPESARRAKPLAPLDDCIWLARYYAGRAADSTCSAIPGCQEARGRRAARRDMARGPILISLVGLPMSPASEIDARLALEFGIKVERSCVWIDSAYARAYEHEMRAEMLRRFHYDVVDQVTREETSKQKAKMAGLGDS